MFAQPIQLSSVLRKRIGLPEGFRTLLCIIGMLFCAPQASAENLSEYEVKSGFLYNFGVFTEWPADVGKTLNLCVYGPDPFGEYLDKLQGKSIGGRSLNVFRIKSVEGLDPCHIVFVARPVMDNLLRVLDQLSGKPVLTIADSPGAMHQGVALNLGTKQGSVTFEVNLAAARANGLKLSSKLLRVASEIRQ